MNLYQYIGLLLSLTAGILSGIFIAKNCNEELKEGAKYIKILMVTLFYIVVFLTSKKIFNNTILLAIIPTLIIFLIFYLPIKIRNYSILLILGACFSLIIKDPSDYVVILLMFIIFICIGSITYYLERKNLVRSLAFKTLVFVIASAIIFFSYATR